MKTRIFLIALSLLLVVSLLLSCSQNSGDNNTEKADNNSSTEAEAEEATEIPVATEYIPDLPKVDMSGKTFTILSSNWAQGYEPLYINDIYSEELNGDPFNDAVYNRIIYMEDKYNIKIEHADMERMISLDSLRKTVNANEDAYDLYLMRAADFNTIVSNRYAVDLGEVEYMNLSQPWWDSNSYESFSLLGKHYGICSDITTNDELAVWCMFFNKNMLQNLALESPYSLVTNGKWTYDKVFEMGKVASKDVNSDGKMDRNDTFGIHTIRDAFSGMLNGAGIFFGEIDKDGNLTFTLKNGDNLTKIINIFTGMFDKNEVYNMHVRGEGITDAQMLSNGQALFDFSGIQIVRRLREMEDDFGILPYPKYDENQAEYMSSISPWYLTLAIIPTTNTDLENTGIIMEEMAYQGYKNLRPAFYENLLQRKIARDSESGEMFDYLFNNVKYDSGAIWNMGGFATSFVMDLVNSYETNVTSYIEKREGMVQTGIDKIMEAME